LREILNPDGSLKLGTGVLGSFDPAGFRIVSGPGGQPIFEPDGPDLQAGGAEIMAAAGDGNWNPQFYSSWTIVTGHVYAIAVSGTDVYVGGQFTQAGGTDVNHIARWNGANWSPLGGGVSGGTYTTVNAIAVSGTDVYVGGDFTSTGGSSTKNRIAKWNTSTNLWSPLGEGLNSVVTAIAVSGTDVYVGGYFSEAGGSPASYIAKWNGSSWSPLGSGLNDGVNAIAVAGTDVYVGGYFTAAGATPANRIAKWNGTSWSALGSGVNDTVNAVAVSGTGVYVGGWFTDAGGVGSADYVARWNGTSWSALGSGVNGPVLGMSISGADVFVGGYFTFSGATPANRVAKWTGSSWLPLGSGLDAQVLSLTVSGRNVYVGGAFFNAGGMASWYLARWVEPISVTSPNGGESWEAFSSHAITWTSEASVGPVKIEYSTNGGLNWSTVTDSAPNTGNYSWTIPNAPSSSCQVRISEAAGGDPEDTSDGTFTIGGLRITSPNGGQQWIAGSQQTITWDSAGSYPTVRLELSTNNGSTWGTITSGASNTGSYVWTVSGTISSQCLIRVSDPADGVPSDASDAAFSIVAVPFIQVTRPNGGEMWEPGISANIYWNAEAHTGSVKIEYSANNGSTWTYIDSYPNSGIYTWTVPNVPSTACLVRISELFTGVPVDTSDATFSITGFHVTSPNGVEWAPESSQTITWDTVGTFPTVRLESSTDNGVTWGTITASTANTGSFPWTVPDVITSQARIRVSDAADGIPSGTGFYSIVEPPEPASVWMISPNGGESWLAGSVHDITWGHAGDAGTAVRITYSTNNGSSFNYIIPTTANDGLYSWTVPQAISSQCLVRILDLQRAVVDTSDAAFSIVATQTITLTSPNGGESWATGSTHNVTWTQVGLAGSVSIDLYRGGVYLKTLGTPSASAGTFPWTIGPAEAEGSNYRVLVWQGSVSDESAADFSLVRFPKRVDFNGDDQEDILWRYEGPGGYIRAWFLGELAPQGLPLAAENAPMIEGRPGNGSDRDAFGPILNRQADALAADSHGLIGARDRQAANLSMVDDPRKAGGISPSLSARMVFDPRQMKPAADGAESLSDPPARVAATTVLLDGGDVMPVGDLSWRIVGTGRFDGDTDVDILWRNISTGSNVVWFMHGTEWAGSAELLRVDDLSWQIVGTGDFDGDGHVDILWRNSSSGSNVVWYMNGTDWTGSAVLLGVSDVNWQIVGTGDFNQDGKADILWRYNGPGGYNVVWYMNGPTWMSSADLIPVGDPTWLIAGTGDYNNDGRVDILWRYNGPGGAICIWYMEGVNWHESGVLLPVADLLWRIVSR
jgi:hypothetical protein